MELTPELKKKIEDMSYEELLRRWRFYLPGDPMFKGEVGEFFAITLVKRREQVGAAQHTTVSKMIGWEP